MIIHLITTFFVLLMTFSINTYSNDAEENKLVIPAEFEEILKFTARGHRQLN